MSAKRTSSGKRKDKNPPERASSSKTNSTGNKAKKSFIAQRRKHLDTRLSSLHRRALHLEKQLLQLEDPRFYRTSIFGSARIKSHSEIYNEVVRLAALLAADGIDILTGGGPGLMEAANKGAKSVGKKSRSRSFGLPIELDHEPDANLHLDIKRHHFKFSSRLDDFMRLSHSVIVTPGGIGTLLELFFVWQLVQVNHLSERPIVLLQPDFWDGLITWMKAQPLTQELLSAKDFRFIHIVRTPEEAFEVVKEHRKIYMQNNKQMALAGIR